MTNGRFEAGWRRPLPPPALIAPSTPYCIFDFLFVVRFGLLLEVFSFPFARTLRSRGVPAQASDGWVLGCICVSLYNESSFHLCQKLKN
jgi:hypothetical protein